MTKQDRADFGRTVALLSRRNAEGFEQRDWLTDAETLHRIAGSLHRIAERECNEDLTCPSCDGDGERDGSIGANHEGRKGSLVSGKCSACAGHGNTLGRRTARLRAQAEAIAEAYGLRCYWQTDPRGCPLYLIDADKVPAVERLGHYVYDCDGPNPDPTTPEMRERLRSRWIDSNYSNAGHAVVWMGR